MEFALEVCETYDATLTHMSKAERGYALARPALRNRAHARRRWWRSRPTSPSAIRFESVVDGALEHLFDNRVPVLSGHPGGVHQSRVAMRRLRAALRAFKGVLPYDRAESVQQRASLVPAGKLAPARDWHVFLDETLPLIAKANPGR